MSFTAEDLVFPPSPPRVGVNRRTDLSFTVGDITFPPEEAPRYSTGSTELAAEVAESPERSSCTGMSVPLLSLIFANWST